MAKEQRSNKERLETQLAEMKEELENFNLPDEAVGTLKGQIRNTEKQIALENDISEMQEVLQDDDTPADIKKTLLQGISEANSQLKKLEAEMPTMGKKKVTAKRPTKGAKPKKQNKSSLADCQEIIARYKKQNANKASRIKKRIKQGKPAELTVPETLKKTAKTVEKKIEDQGQKRITIAQQDAAISQIVEIAAAILDGLKPQQYTAFIDKLNKAIRGHLVRPKKAEEGIVIQQDDNLPEFGENQTVSGNMRIDSYRTKHFDISPDAQKLFDELIRESERVGINTDTTHVLRNAADDLDRMLQIVKEVQVSGRATRKDFTEAVSLSMLFMYWLGKLLDRLPQESNIQKFYPRFLPGYLYTIAMKLPEDTTPEMAAFGKRLLSAVNRDRKYQSDQPWERAYKRSGTPKHPHYAKAGYDFGKSHEAAIKSYLYERLENSGIDVEEFKHKVAQAIMDMHHGPTGIDDYRGFKITTAEIADLLDKADMPHTINYDRDTMEISEDEPSMDQIADGDWREVGVKRVLLGGDLYSYVSCGGKLTANKGAKIDINPEYHWFVFNPAKKKIFAGYEFNVDAKELVKEMKEVNPYSNLVVYGSKHLKTKMDIDPYDQTNWSNENAACGASMAKGGTAGKKKSVKKGTFKAKVKAISKSLTGKKVPGKYAKVYGKRYSKKEAGNAAKRIAGAVKGIKKAYAGMTIINAPDNSAVAHGGEGILGTPRN